MSRLFMPGEWVESGERGSEAYDYGRVMSTFGDEAVVKWRLAGKTYTEDMADLRPYQPDNERIDQHDDPQYQTDQLGRYGVSRPRRAHSPRRTTEG